MPGQEEINNQQELLATYRRRLARQLVQQAQLGEAYAPPGIFEDIREARESIRRIKEILRAWDVAIEDHPDDEPPTADSPVSTPPRPNPRPGAPPVSRRMLREVLLRAFSLSDLEVLCADVQEDLAQDGIDLLVSLTLVGGDDLAATVVRLINYLARRGYLDYLVRAVRRARPNSI